MNNPNPFGFMQCNGTNLRPMMMNAPQPMFQTAQPFLQTPQAILQTPQPFLPSTLQPQQIYISQRGNIIQNRPGYLGSSLIARPQSSFPLPPILRLPYVVCPHNVVRSEPFPPSHGSDTGSNAPAMFGVGENELKTNQQVNKSLLKIIQPSQSSEKSDPCEGKSSELKDVTKASHIQPHKEKQESPPIPPPDESMLQKPPEPRSTTVLTKAPSDTASLLNKAQENIEKVVDGNEKGFPSDVTSLEKTKSIEISPSLSGIKKQRKKRKLKKKSKMSDSINLEDHYYSKQETPHLFSKATPKLIELHKQFEDLCDGLKQIQSTEKIDDIIPYNVDEQKPTCDCDDTSLDKGIHHNVFPGEQPFFCCDPLSNNADLLHHYKLIIEPEYNFQTKKPSTIYYNGKEFQFEGFSLFSHSSLDEMPPYLFKRNSFDYKVLLKKQELFPQTFCVTDLNLISKYLFHHLFELYDWKFDGERGCSFFHFMPRFVCRSVQGLENGHPILNLLPMAELLKHLKESYTPFYDTKQHWMDLKRANQGCIVTNRNKNPRCIRCDQVTDDVYEKIYKPKDEKRRRKHANENPVGIHCIKDDTSKKEIVKNDSCVPTFVHCARLSTVSKETLKRFRSAADELKKMKKKMKSRVVLSQIEKKELFNLQHKVDHLLEERKETKIKEIHVSAEGFYQTGLRWDVCQHTSYLHGLWKYLKFMNCLHKLEEKINYTFKDKSLLKAALTLPSFQDQSSMSSCTLNSVRNAGKKLPEFNVQLQNRDDISGRRKGALHTAEVMATLFDKNQTKSSCQHNERLEFLGDAILDYLTSLHLFLMFPEKEAGRLTQFRCGIVQANNLNQIANELDIGDFLLRSHRRPVREEKVFVNSDVKGEDNEEVLLSSEMKPEDLQDEKIYDEGKKENLANALEAIIGAVYLDGGINAVDTMLAVILFLDDDSLSEVWKTRKKHPLQIENPKGDRDMIAGSKVLQKIVGLEEIVGVKFKNIRLLAKAFTHSIHGLPDPSLTSGDYNRLEFLGDAVLKYVTSDYLYKHFPKHQEGHLSLLRMSLVNAKCLVTAAKDLNLDKFIIYSSSRVAETAKEKVYSDVYEGALHIDRCAKGLRYCQKMIEVSILSRLKEVIINQDWLDPKSLLQQCCSNGDNVVYPKYVCDKKVVERGFHKFHISVYHNGRKLGLGVGRSIKEGQKEAARDALKNNHFEQHAEHKKLLLKKFGPAKKNNDDEKLELTKSENSTQYTKEEENKELNQKEKVGKVDIFLIEPYEWGS